MKPRYRVRADGSREFLTHDGFVSVSVSGSEALPSLGRGAPRLPSLSERKVVIDRVALKALHPMTHRTRNELNLAGGEHPRSFPVLPVSHVSLPHGEQVATLHFAEVRNVHAE